MKKGILLALVIMVGCVSKPNPLQEYMMQINTNIVKQDTDVVRGYFTFIFDSSKGTCESYKILQKYDGYNSKYLILRNNEEMWVDSEKGIITNSPVSLAECKEYIAEKKAKAQAEYDRQQEEKAKAQAVIDAARAKAQEEKAKAQAEIDAARAKAQEEYDREKAEEKAKAQAEIAMKRKKLLEKLNTFKGQVKFELVRWEKGGFNNVMLINSKIYNATDKVVKDFTIECFSSGNSGTVINLNKKVMYDFVDPMSMKEFNFNMGFIDPQATSTQCKIIDFK